MRERESFHPRKRENRGSAKPRARQSARQTVEWSASEKGSSTVPNDDSKKHEERHSRRHYIQDHRMHGGTNIRICICAITRVHSNQDLIWCVKIGCIWVFGSSVGPDYYGPP